MNIENRLNEETSPYLLQHANNPVDWQPWDEAALRLAQDLKKPILLSIGYSACHWCHVMAHESFEDTESAALMNELFINIKVDREERPDIDKIYQLAHSAITRNTGGWPLTMFLTPDQTPFFGGTYFPLTPRYGMPAFKDILIRVSNYLKEEHDEVKQQNNALHHFFRSLDLKSNSEPPFEPDLIPALLDQVREDLLDHLDPINGGFGDAPKFPHTPNIERALFQWYRSEKQDNQSLHAAELTLNKMAAGGIYDHLAGGFFRYSVDNRWCIPHFEKMLYDNGTLLSLYARASVTLNKRTYKDRTKATAEWVIKEMQSQEGGYFSTLDADSEGIEGKFYRWTPSEIKEGLNEKENQAITQYYGLSNPPNFENHWHLQVAQAEQSMSTDDPLTLECAIKKLNVIRAKRTPPERDEKILPAWNGLMIKGMAQAGRYLMQNKYTHSAEKAVDFIFNNMFEHTHLFATYKNGTAKYPAYLDDYAFLLDGVFELLQSNWNDLYVQFATQLCDILLSQFEDSASGGFYFTSNNHEKLLFRPKSAADEAMPSGAAVAAYSLNRWGYLLGNTNYINSAERAISSAHEQVTQSPLAHSSFLLAFEEIASPPNILILRCSKNKLQKWKKLSARYYKPHSFLFIIPNELETPYPTIREKHPQGEHCLYLCEGNHCQAPIVDETNIKNTLN